LIAQRTFRRSSILYVNNRRMLRIVI